jgi:hypothetical protein
LLVAVVTACAGLGRPPLELVVEDVTTGRVLHHEPVRPLDTFTLAYVHSSEHVPVRGVFRIAADRTMRVIETAFGGFGPGLPALKPGDEWRIEDGMIVARVSEASMGELVVRIVPITRHRLMTPLGAELDLSTLMGAAGGAVKIFLR